MTSLPSIPEFFKDKTIFITGGSGFIGKVLIEKLLRSCPDLKTIYVLLRHKKGKTPEERIKAITDLPLFDLLKSQNPSALAKLRPVSGDVNDLNLGLTPQTRRLLIEETNIIFHSAASVRFDDPLDVAVKMNTRGTREVMSLALEVKNLDVLVHISTAYCNTDRTVVDELLYPAHADWEKTIEYTDNVDTDTLNDITEKYISPLPNTYTFSKSLAEHVVYDMGNGKIPVVIFRPSIVISSALEPMPGWTDNFNGPAGLLLAIAKGVVRTLHTDPDQIQDYVPVDLVVKALIISAWKQVVIMDAKESMKTTVYNGCNNNISNVTNQQIQEMGNKLCWEVPLNYPLWYPRCSLTKCIYYHWICLILYQFIPALIVDGLLKIIGYKPLLMRIQRRIYTTIKAYKYFTDNRWTFINNNAVSLENILLPCDFEAFSYHKDRIEVYSFFKNAAIGGRRYLLKESDDTIEAAKTYMKGLWILSHIVNVLWYLLLFWILFVKIDIVSIVYARYIGVHHFLNSE